MSEERVGEVNPYRVAERLLSENARLREAMKKVLALPFGETVYDHKIHTDRIIKKALEGVGG